MRQQDPRELGHGCDEETVRTKSQTGSALSSMRNEGKEGEPKARSRDSLFPNLCKNSILPPSCPSHSPNLTSAAYLPSSKPKPRVSSLPPSKLEAFRRWEVRSPPVILLNQPRSVQHHKRMIRQGHFLIDSTKVLLIPISCVRGEGSRGSQTLPKTQNQRRKVEFPSELARRGEEGWKGKTHDVSVSRDVEDS